MQSEQFGDIYFSAEDGLAETLHTFLAGNGLPAAWMDRTRFCICETGFGTGLNMLAAWRAFEESAGSGQFLDLVSIEKYPLAPAQIREALAAWDFGGRLERMLALYPPRIRGFHRLNLTERVTLTLVFDDVSAALPQLSARVDAWFLDGFAPAKNPEMWGDVLYREMARLSAPGASVASFTAAGAVRRGLAAAGFAVEKRGGYGRKRDMTVGHFTGAGANPPISPPARVAVIGAGLAGASAAWHLKRAGCAVTVYERAGAASGASGNDAGLINPKLTARESPHSRYYTSAYSYALGMLADRADAVAARCGTLHLEMDDDKARRFAAYRANLGWEDAHMRYLDAGAASDAAGVSVATPGLFYPDALAAHPREIVRTLLDGVDLRAQDIDAPARVEADVVVLAAGADIARFCDLPIGRVRGQVSRVMPGPDSARVRAALCYGGYFSPVLADGMHVCGATFQPWDDDISVREADHARNIAQALTAIPALGDGMRVAGGRTGFRAASKDRFPVVGAHNGVYLSAAHGSHGMISGLIAGAVLAAHLCGGPMPVARDALAALDPGRFLA